MCGRYMLTNPTRLEPSRLGLDQVLPLTPRYNIAPGQSVALVRSAAAGREMVLVRWGLVPAWATDPAIGHRLANARAETAHEKPSFRSAFRRRRALLPADGFYEWQAGPAGVPKQPWAIRLPDAEPFWLAALWERWTPREGEPLETCTVLTTDANTTLRPIHDRMPVLLPEAALDGWLDPAASVTALRALLVPWAGVPLETWPVSTYVNAVRHEDAGCLAGAGGEGRAGDGP